jgi:hypothetical protein
VGFYNGVIVNLIRGVPFGMLIIGGEESIGPRCTM